MPVKKLVARKAVVTEAFVSEWEVGDTYIQLQDPNTGVSYGLKEGWSVTGENLEELFDELGGETSGVDWADQVE